MIVQPHFFKTSDMVEGRDYILQNTGTHLFELDRSAQFSFFQARQAAIGHSSVNALEWNCLDSFVVEKVEKRSIYSFHFITQGQCEVWDGTRSFTANPGNIYVLHPSQRAHEHWMGDCRQFIVRVSADDIDAAISKILGRKLPDGVHFNTQNLDPGISDWLNSLPQLYVDGRTSIYDDKRVAYHIEQSLIMMLLGGLSHSCSIEMEHIKSTAAPYYIRRVETYFREHYSKEITMDDIVAASGVSMRTVFYGFKRWRGTSPMGYLRDMRLDIAQTILDKRHLGARSVSSTALAVGFTNFSQFSKLYKSRFGQKPSMTTVETF